MGDRILKDSAGTPANYGDTVELIKDKLGNDRLGPELVVNGGFEDSSQWGLDPGWSISDGKAAFVQVGSGNRNVYASGQALLVAGKFYLIEFDVISGSGFRGYVGGTMGPISEGAGTRYSAILKANAAKNFLVNGGGATDGAIDNISVREVLGNHASQPNASLKPVLGRVPVGGRRNLLNFTEDLTNDYWYKQSCTTEKVTEPGPFKGATVTRVTLDLENSYLLGGEVTLPIGTNKAKVWVKGEGAAIGKNLRSWPWKIGSSPVSGIPTRPDLTLDGTWQEATSALEVTSSGTVRFRVGQGMENRMPAGSSFLVSMAQMETADTLGTYQRVTSDLDVYEPGAEHIEYLRFDGIDDCMTQTFPDGFEGDLIVCGTKGSWIDEGVSIPAGGELTIGPKNLPNTPNILPALGDIIGWVPVSRTTTEEERQRIIEYYKGRGAKGRLVPGPELVVNGAFDTDVSGWSYEGDLQYDAGNQRAYLIPSTYNQNFINVDGVLPKVGKSYIARATILQNSGNTRGYELSFGNDRKSIPVVSGVETIIEAVLNPINTVSKFSTRMAGLVTGYEWWVDNVSVRELIPEEDLV